MGGFLARIFGAAERAPPPDERRGDELDSRMVAVRFRPHLIVDLGHENEALRAAMRAVLDACRGHDEDARVLTLQRFAGLFRHACLTKSVHLYPYLRWALEQDRSATIQLKALDADVQRSVCTIDAMLSDYLDAPWLSERKRRHTADMAKLAHLLAKALKLEETSVFPLYMTPGQYRYVRATWAG